MCQKVKAESISAGSGGSVSMVVFQDASPDYVKGQGHAPLVLGQLGPVGFGVAYGHVRPTDDSDEQLAALTGFTHVMPGHGHSGSTALGSGFDGRAHFNGARGHRSSGLSLATLCAQWLPQVQ